MRPSHRLTIFGVVLGVSVAIACYDVAGPDRRARRSNDGDPTDTLTDSLPPSDTTPPDTTPVDTVPVDTVPVDTVRPDTGGIVLQPLCGNSFTVLNARDSAVVATYTVGAAARRDTLRLPPRPSDAAHSETYLTTAAGGTVRLFLDTLQVQEAEPSGAACPARGRIGEWTPTFTWPMIGVHTTLLPDGQVLTFGRNNDPQLLDPSTDVFTPVPSATHVFCGGHALLPDGRLLVTGGHIASDRGKRDANVFDPTAHTWTRVRDMARGRWYPTTTTLPNGEALVIGGADSNAKQVSVAEVWQANGTWRRLTNASRTFPYYPRTFVAPDGRVFYAGIQRTSRYLSTSGTGRWTTGPTTKYEYEREYGSAVMYEAGRVMIAGGGGRYKSRLPTATTEIINLNAATRSWQYTGKMANRRRQLNLTLAPTGEVIATGGSSGTGFNNEAMTVHAAEAWSPATGRWRTLAANPAIRLYHSTTLLLPDGRILSAGGGDADTLVHIPDYPSGEYFLPPYLFRPDGERAARPTITAVPSVVRYGAQVPVLTPNGGSVRQARWIRLGSSTHAFDQNQRANTLAVAPMVGGVTVTTPASPNLAPPGHYMLFLIDHNGVPSVGKIVQVVR